MKLKKGDNVKVVAGKDKGKTGKVEKVMPKINKVLVSGVNLYKKHLKARSGRQKSEIITLTKPLPFANVRLICPKCNLETRVGFKIVGGLPAGKAGKKLRICRKCEKEI